MINIGFERIDPAPTYPAGTSLQILSNFDWGSNANLVVSFKQHVKKELRLCQLGKCCYCRRQLFDDGATHIEHFIDKSVHPQFTFEVRNLALSCGTCNGMKNGHSLTLSSALKRRANKYQKVVAARVPVLAVLLAPGAAYPVGSNSFRWVHPHFDNYSQNIGIRKGWIFTAVSRKGLRTIEKVRLNAVSQIERRALHERMATRGGVLSLLVGALAELDSHRAGDVAAVVAKVLRRRRGSHKPRT